VFGAVVAVVVIATRRGTGKTALPFGPFMLLGVVAGVVFGADLASAYWGVLGA
jgi:leader peptidase (prepilin peptidase)/N-methyltransferase